MCHLQINSEVIEYEYAHWPEKRIRIRDLSENCKETNKKEIPLTGLIDDINYANIF